jgi:hypothetical protein
VSEYGVKGPVSPTSLTIKGTVHIQMSTSTSKVHPKTPQREKKSYSGLIWRLHTMQRVRWSKELKIE